MGLLLEGRPGKAAKTRSSKRPLSRKEMGQPEAKTVPRAAPVGGNSIGPQLRSKILCQVKQSLFFPGAATYRSH